MFLSRHEVLNRSLSRGPFPAGSHQVGGGDVPAPVVSSAADSRGALLALQCGNDRN